MDQFLILLQDISLKILPFIGCLVLGFLISLIRKLILLIHDLTKTLERVNKTIDSANRTLDDLQEPLNTVKNVASSIDRANAFGNKVVEDAFKFVAENINNFIDFFKNLFSKNSEEIENSEEEKINGWK